MLAKFTFGFIFVCTVSENKIAVGFAKRVFPYAVAGGEVWQWLLREEASGRVDIKGGEWRRGRTVLNDLAGAVVDADGRVEEVEGELEEEAKEDGRGLEDVDDFHGGRREDGLWMRRWGVI